VKDKTTE